MTKDKNSLRIYRDKLIMANVATILHVVSKKDEKHFSFKFLSFLMIEVKKGGLFPNLERLGWGGGEK